MTGDRVDPVLADLVRVLRTATSTPRLALTPDEAAKAIGVSRDFFDAHIAPELRIVRRGRRCIIAVAEVEAWLNRAGERTLRERP